MSRNVEYHLYLTVPLANVFSVKSIQDTDPALRMAMEEVAGRAEKLAKDKVTDVPPPFRKKATPSVYSKVYSMGGREARDRRAEQRRMRATGIEKLGDKEYKKLLEEIDQMSQTPVNMEELINKRMQEITERLEAEEKEKEAEERRKTRSQDRPGTSQDTELTPTRRLSPRKRKPDAETEKDKSKKEAKKPDSELKVRQSEQVDIDDASKSRKDRTAKRPKQSKTSAIPMIRDDDDDDDVRILDDKADKDYEPQQEEDDDDDNAYPIDDDDDDFQEPPPRSRKPIKPSKKPTRSTTRRVEKPTKSKDDEAEDETLALFQKIVGPDFEVRASEEFEEDPKDKCGNPVEAAGFRATMKMMALELKKAVRKGENIEKTYTDMIRSTIEVAKAMKYPGATTVELKDIVPAIKDLKCNAWRKYLRGTTKMDPADVEIDDDAPENEDDLIIQGPILGKESTEAAAEAIHKLPQMLLTDTKKQLKHLFEHTMQAHQHAAEASKCLKELHDKLPLDIFLRIVDSAVRPLVVLHIPRTEQIIEKLKETAVQKTQRRKKEGSTEVEEVMITRNLPQCGKWTAEEEYHPRKMIASIIYKYVREAMFKGKAVTQLVVDEFGLPKTTIHRQIYGKKYPGGGQTLEKLRKEDKKVEATGSGTRKIAVIFKKSKTDADTEVQSKKFKKSKTDADMEVQSKKGKGSGKSSGKKRSAQDIRGAATAEEEKRKREVKKRKALEEEEEEDPDMPTKEEIAASKPASKTLFIH